MNGLHRLVASAHGREGRLTSRAKLSKIIVNGSAFGAVSGHLRNVSNGSQRPGWQDQPGAWNRKCWASLSSWPFVHL